MTLKASPLSNRGVRLGVPPADESKWTHSGGVPQHRAYSIARAPLQGAILAYSVPRVLALLAPTAIYVNCQTFLKKFMPPF